MNITLCTGGGWSFLYSQHSSSPAYTAWHIWGRPCPRPCKHTFSMSSLTNRCGLCLYILLLFQWLETIFELKYHRQHSPPPLPTQNQKPGGRVWALERSVAAVLRMSQVLGLQEGSLASLWDTAVAHTRNIHLYCMQEAQIPGWGAGEANDSDTLHLVWGLSLTTATGFLVNYTQVMSWWASWALPLFPKLLMSYH